MTNDDVRRRSRRLRTLSTRWMLGTALATMAASAPYAYAQEQQSIETVVVTGTAIRGAAPTGSNLITVDRNDIEATGAQTTQELLTNIPQVNINFGSSGQAIEGGGGDISLPTIHSLGNQNANSTLVLIDGHRMPLVGQTSAGVDPSIVPTMALQRVDVLPDGASSIYGADAIAGVLNFITRKDISGMEVSSQYDVAANYAGSTFGALIGSDWTGGSVVAAYSYSSLSNLLNADRSYIGARQDIIKGATTDTALFPAIPAAPPAGSMTTTPAAGSGTTGPYGVAIPYPSTGSNLQNFNCPTATIAANSTASVFLYPYSGTGISTTQTTPSQGVCDSNSLLTSLPSQTRNDAFVSFHQALTNSLGVSVELIYGVVDGTSLVSRGTLSATAFGPGGTGGPLGTSQVNPFYVGNSTTGTKSEFIRIDFNELLGGPAYTHVGATTASSNVTFDWDMGHDWVADFNIDLAQSQAPQTTVGSVCAACALLALNGTTNTSGTANTTPSTSALVDAYGLNTVYSATRALTTLNALDVWDPPGSTNKTSQATLSSLVDGNADANTFITLEDYYTKFDGPLFDLGSGPVRAAFGLEYEQNILNRLTQSDSSIGPASQLSTTSQKIGIAQTTYAAFAEFQIPIVDESKGIPLVQAFAFDLSGRFSHFGRDTGTALGNAKNPKIGFTWTIIDGVKARGSYGTSFQAPQITTQGSIPSVASGGFANGTVVAFNSALPYSTDNTFSGGGIGGTWVSTAASCAAAGSTVVDANGNTVAAPYTAAAGCKVSSSASPGLTLGGTTPNLKPQTGTSYSAGFDIDGGKVFDYLDGLTLSATYYNTKFMGFVTNQGINVAVPQTNAFAPIGGWTTTSPVIQNLVSGKTLSLALPPVIWSITDGQVINAYTLWQSGVDFSIRYRYPTDNLGTFTFGLDGNQIIVFNQQAEGGILPVVSIVDGDNGGRETGIELTAVGSIGWRLAPFQAQLMVDFAHPYSVINTSFPYNLAGPGRPAGYEHIGPLYNTNLHVSYDLPTDFWGVGAVSTGLQVFFNVDNMLNTPPIYEDTVSGSGGGSQIGREFIFGFRKQF